MTRPGVAPLIVVIISLVQATGHAQPGQELAGKLVILNPSHGSTWDNLAGRWRRAMRTLCGPNPATNRPPGWTGSTYNPSDFYYWTAGFRWPSFYEDDLSPETIRFLAKYVESSGAEVWLTRNLDRNAGDFDYAAYGYPNCPFPLPRWQVAAKYYLQERGDVPDFVWNPPVGGEEWKDVYSRAYYANYRMELKYPGQDQASEAVWGDCVSFTLHSNAGTYDTARGTETFWNTYYYPHLQDSSSRLARTTHDGVINAIRNQYDGSWADAMYPVGSTPPEWPNPNYGYVGYAHGGDASTRWQDRGVKTNSGNPEIVLAKMPSAFCELAFHDDWKYYPDHVFMLDQIFRATVAWGFYEGICSYFDVAPRTRLDASLVSVEFPPAAAVNEMIHGTITIRNDGMAWCWGHRFEAATKEYLPYTVWHLKATPEDQFAPGTRVAIAEDAVTYPGQVATFSISLTAPATPGVYTTQWQMSKADAMGGDFGGLASAEIVVCSAAAPDFDHDCDVDEDDFLAFKACATGPALAYQPARTECPLPLDTQGYLAADFDRDLDVDMDDFAIFQRCYTGAGPTALDCPD